MSDWVRPEDVHHYEELCNKTGKNLTLKLTDRARTTDWLTEVVKAYAEKSYNGNLFYRCISRLIPCHDLDYVFSLFEIHKMIEKNDPALPAKHGRVING